MCSAREASSQKTLPPGTPQSSLMHDLPHFPAVHARGRTAPRAGGMRDVLKKRVGDYDIGRTLGEVWPKTFLPRTKLGPLSIAACKHPLGCRAHMPK